MKINFENKNKGSDFKHTEDLPIEKERASIKPMDSFINGAATQNSRPEATEEKLSSQFAFVEDERMESPPKLGFELSSSVMQATESLNESPVSASAVAGNVFKIHSEYAQDKAESLKLQETALKRTPKEWIDSIMTLFNPSHIKEISKIEGPAILHGRLAVIGLCLLEPQLRTQLDQGGVFDILVGELNEPIREILTERGLNLYEPPESVPNQPDDPLKSVKDDRLGRGAFAKYLAKRILAVPSDSEAYSIHVYGPWGSGKSTMLNFLKTELESGNEWIVADFNAWRHQHIKPPWWALMETVFQQTKHELARWERFLEFWWRFNTGRIQYLIALILIAWVFVLILPPLLKGIKPESNWLSYWATTADNLSKIFAVVLTIWGIIRASSQSLLIGSSKAAQSYMELTHDSMNEIKKRFKTLIERLKPKRVAVFIDDLDRCQSKYVVQLLEGVQTLFREAQVVFVVAADRNWLNACYEENYDKLKPFVCQPGKDIGVLFLEKIFQFSTSVPGIPAVLKEKYWESLIQAKSPDEQKEAIEAQRAAVELMDKAASEGSIIHLVNTSRGKSFAEQRAMREEAVIRLAAPKVVERTEHALKVFVGLLEPNPRAMKRLVNTYSVNRALAFLSYIDIDRDRLALWSILSLRWPLLSDYLEKNPEMVQAIVQQKLISIPKNLEDLAKDNDVLNTVKGGPKNKPLDSDTIRQCALLRG